VLIVVVISIIMSIFVAIQDPIIQKFTIRIAGGYISHKTGADVRIGRLYISPNFTIHIDQLSVKDLNNNNLLHIEELKVRPLMEEIIHGDIHLSSVELKNAEADLITYEGDDHMNLQFLIDAFSSGEKKEKESSTKILIDQIIFDNVDFQFWNQNKDKPEKTANHEMDYAHIDLDSINLNVENLVIIGDSINALIHHLSASDVSGFTLDHLESQTIVSQHGILLDGLQVQTGVTKLNTDLHMLYSSFKDFGDFVNTVNFDTKIRPSTIQVSDLGPFSKILYDMTDPVRFEGWMKGPIKSFNVDDLKLAFGKETQFSGSLALQPLDFKNGHHVLNINKLNYSIDDLNNFHIPIPSKTIPIPQALSALGRGTIKGYFKGSMNRFNADLTATSEIGNVSATLEKRLNELRYNVFEGHVDAERLNVGLLANVSKIVGDLDLNAEVTAQQTPEGLNLDINGSIVDVALLGNNINQIDLNGNLFKNRFDGIVKIDDEDLNMGFNGSFDFSNPKSLGGNFHADITSADLHKLNIIKNDPTALVSGSISANATSLNDFNNAEGTLSIKDFSFKNSNGDLAMESLDASIINDKLMQKRINLDCDFLRFEMAGKMNFATLVTAFKQYVQTYVEIPQWTDDLAKFEESGKSSDQDFIVNMTVYDTKPLTDMFAPSISIANNTTLSGTFTSRSNSLNMTLRSKYVKINNIKINDIECKSLSSPRRSITRLSLDNIILRDSTEKEPTMLSLDNMAFTAMLQNDSIKAHLFWDDISKDDHSKADVHMSYIPMIGGGHFSINQANIVLNDTAWTVHPDNFIDVNFDKIHFSNVQLISHHQSLKIDGMLPMTQEDTLSVDFNAFNLSTFDRVYQGIGLDFDGFVYGNAQVNDLKDNMTIFANLNILNFGMDGHEYGDIEIASQWNNANESIEVDLGLINQRQKALNLSGAFYPQRKGDNLDFKLGVDSLNLAIASPFLGNIAQRLQGYCFGDIDIKGSLKNIDVQGKVKVKDGGCKINFLNTFYTFSPTVTVTNELISFSDLTLTDTLGNTAMVNGSIIHDHFKNMYLDFKLYPNNFLALATNASLSPSFYGTAVANGVVAIQGPTNNLTLDIKARTRKGTDMTIPIGGNSNVKKHEFITFVDRKAAEMEQDTIVEKPVKKKQSNNINIGMDLAVNNDALVKISLPNGLGSMEAKGDGDIKLGLATATNDMTLIGDYVISSGSLSLNIKDVIRRNFILDPGSKISWTGSPVNGTINATGVYQTKVALSSLGLIDSTNMSSNNVKVECLVRLKNKLLNPDISFGLRLPNATEDLQMAVFNVIDTNNQANMLMQAVSLLVLNSFTYGSSVNSYDIITGQLNDFISKFTNNIDININYKPGDDLSNEEMTVDLKKQLFDDRLTIETNFGVIIPNSTNSTNTTNIIGDVNIDYKITKDGRLSAQIFNRSNYNTVYYQYTYYKMAPYTQGIGLSYKKSFDRLRDLFRKRGNPILPSRPVISKSSVTDSTNPNDNEPNNQKL
jgi:hypothetical protein